MWIILCHFLYNRPPSALSTSAFLRRTAAFVRSHTIGVENKRTKNTTMLLAIKTIEVQVIGGTNKNRGLEELRVYWLF